MRDNSDSAVKGEWYFMTKEHLYTSINKKFDASDKSSYDASAGMFE